MHPLHQKKGVFALKDDRFIPVDRREPVDDFEDYSGDANDFDSSLFVGGEAADADELEQSKGARKLMKDILYIAS